MRKLLLCAVTSLTFILAGTSTPAETETCCEDHTGDANMSGDDWPTVGDVSILIEVLYLSQDWGWITCLDEADADASGGLTPTQDDITLRDLALILERAFITGTPLPYCNTPEAFDDVDHGAQDSLIAEIVYLGSEPDGQKVAVNLYMYNDVQDVRMLSSGFSWDTEKAILDSAALSETMASLELPENIQFFEENHLPTSNAEHLFRFVDLGYAAIAATSASRTHLATYYFTLSDWGADDYFCIELAPNIALDFVTPDLGEYSPEWGSPGCYPDMPVPTATGDPNGDGTVNASDLNAMIDYLYHGGAAPLYPYEADLNGDCILDLRDIQALDCMVFYSPNDPTDCDMIDVYPATTCEDPTPVFYNEPPTAVGDAVVTEETDGYRVDNIGTTGEDGISLHPTSYERGKGMRMDLENVDLAVTDASLGVSFSAWIEDESKFAFAEGSSIQQVGMAGITQVSGMGQFQITGNFNPIGDPEVGIEIYNRDSGLPSMSATVSGGGVIATGTSTGPPAQVRHVAVLGNKPPVFSFRFDQIIQFTLATSPPVQGYGNEINLVARNATRTITGVGPTTITSGYIGWFGVNNMKDGACCVGFVGNANMDPTDAMTIGDISVMIDHLFINEVPLECLEEADVNLSGVLLNPPLDETDITIGDISVMIDHLFLAQDPVSVCP